MMTMNWAAAMSPSASQRRRLGVSVWACVEDMVLPFWCVVRCRERRGDACPVAVPSLSHKVLLTRR